MELAEVPDAFVQLQRAGRLDYWGAPYHSLTAERRQELVPIRMLQVLWWDEVIEWDRTVDDVLGFERDALIRPGFVPFAGNGYGDQFCWYPRWQEGPEPPVVFYVHDELNSRLFARDFGECLSRCMLQHFAADEPGDGEPSRRALWDAHLDIIRPFIRADQADLLDRVGSDVASADCAAADAEIAAAVGKRTLIGALQPTQYQDESIVQFGGWESLLRSYDTSVAFYEELVDDEGLMEYASKLDEARAARETARRNSLS